ncbi:hypothetical protein J3A83DRAFT_4515316 [Scleroderma citrinum]
MSKFSEVTYDPASQTAVIGAGLIWDDVYSALEPYGVNVVGGRVTGVGVAGLILGGGYSWLTNEHGLAIDNVEAFELVTSSGDVISVTQSSYQDLFYALKGGFNNFGIVTRFTLKAYPQGQVWGGLLIYPGILTNQVNAANADFAANCSDPRAQIISTYQYDIGVPVITQLLFYNDPSPPTGIFDKFLSIPSLTRDIGTRSFLSLVRSAPSNMTQDLRGVFNVVPVTGFPIELLQTIADEALHWAKELVPLSGVFISYSVEPFLPTIFSHSTSPSAYPGSRDRSFSVLFMYFAWITSLADELMQNAVRTSAAKLFNTALELGQDIEDGPLCPNFAMSDTPLERMYGDNVQSLRAIKRLVDPNNVMGLAGGFKF